jgi:hypothetical protein
MTHRKPPAPARVRRRSVLGGLFAAVAAALAPRRAHARSRGADAGPDRRSESSARSAQSAGRSPEAKRPIWIGHL